jgi:transposase
MPVAANGPALCTSTAGARKFVAGDPHAIVIGVTRLEEYLTQAGQREPFIVARLLDEQDWTPFEQRYAATGRTPYSPRQRMGLILYGVMQAVSALRELARLARLDLGCMWVSGGMTPDHADIGRFIALHEASLTQDLFESLTRSILKASRSSGKRLAGDGTVIAAACSHDGLLKEEAVRQRTERAREALAQTPNEANCQRQAGACRAVPANRRGAAGGPAKQRQEQ